MTNASEENRQNQTDTPRCPSWCVRHEEQGGHPDDHALIHYGDEEKVAGYWVQVYRYDWRKEGRSAPVGIRFEGGNDGPLTPQEATALAAMLASTAAKVDPEEKTIVRTLDLPVGEEYVVFDDINVVALSSRLNERGRMEVLSSLGLT